MTEPDSETEPGPDDSAAILAERVSCGGGTYKPFSEMTLADVSSRAEELTAASQVPAMAQRTGPVASAWRGLAEQMKREDAATVGDLEPADVAGRAERLWIVPPGGSLL